MHRDETGAGAGMNSFCFPVKYLFNVLQPKTKLSVRQNLIEEENGKGQYLIDQVKFNNAKGNYNYLTLVCNSAGSGTSSQLCQVEWRKDEGLAQGYLATTETVCRLLLTYCPSVNPLPLMTGNRIIRLSCKWFNTPGCKLQSANKVVLTRK